MTDTNVREPIRWWDVVMGLLAIALVLAGFYYGWKHAVGRAPLADEPPIRVRNGSMKLILDAAKWDVDSDGDDVDDDEAWVVSGRMKSGRNYLVDIKGTPTCNAKLPFEGTRVLIDYGEKLQVRLSPGMQGARVKTMVRPRDSIHDAGQLDHRGPRWGARLRHAGSRQGSQERVQGRREAVRAHLHLQRQGISGLDLRFFR